MSLDEMQEFFLKWSPGTTRNRCLIRSCFEELTDRGMQNVSRGRGWQHTISNNTSGCVDHYNTFCRLPGNKVGLLPVDENGLSLERERESERGKDRSSLKSILYKNNP